MSICFVNRKEHGLHQFLRHINLFQRLLLFLCERKIYGFCRSPCLSFIFLHGFSLFATIKVLKLVDKVFRRRYNPTVKLHILRKEEMKMKMSSTKEFPFSIDVAWAALHQPAKLDVEPGAEVHEISDIKWEAHSKDADTVNTYEASFDDANKVMTIETTSNVTHSCDHMYFTLKEIEPNRVSLEIIIEINTGAHLLAKALGYLFAKPIQEIMCKQIYHNFEALCKGSETKRMSMDELKGIAKEKFEKKNS